MNSLKVAFIVNRFPAVSETFIINQIVHLLDRSHDVKIFSLGAKPANNVHGVVSTRGLIERTSYFLPTSMRWARKLTYVLRFSISSMRELGWKFAIKDVLRLNYKRSVQEALIKFIESHDFDVV